LSDSQISLLPVQLVDEQPFDKSSAKDLLWTGADEQGRRYALKTVESANRLLPLTEWLCYHLCAQMGVLTPDFTVVVRLDGTLAFGSRWEADARQFSPGRVSDAQFVSWVNETKSDVAGMFALDALMPNEDRHFGNILFIDTGARLRALAFDWSRTRIFQPWPWPPECKSWRSWNWLLTAGFQDLKVVSAKLERVREITSGMVSNILKAAPAEWRENFDVDEAAIWWDSNKAQRTEDVIRLLTP